MKDRRCNLGQHTDVWRPPEEEEVKCNIGMRWSKKNGIVGAAWVLRNKRGEVLLNSPGSFGAVESKDEAYFLCLVCSVESMCSHKCLNVSFALEGRGLVNAINRQISWPSFKFKVLQIRNLFRNFLKWRVAFESFEANRGACLIADSAVQLCRFQSYVARGQPTWLSYFFD